MQAAGGFGYALVAPAGRDEPASVATAAYTLKDARDRLAAGDVFAKKSARTGSNLFADAARRCI